MSDLFWSEVAQRRETGYRVAAVVAAAERTDVTGRAAAGALLDALADQPRDPAATTQPPARPWIHPPSCSTTSSTSRAVTGRRPRPDQPVVHPALRAATARRSPSELDELARFKPTFGIGTLDSPEAWNALRAAILRPEPGDQPHSDLQAALTGWSPEEAKRMAVRVWRRRDNDPENADLWDALAAEVTAAGGIDGPAALDRPCIWTDGAAVRHRAAARASTVATE
jgi:hypothetical protein